MLQLNLTRGAYEITSLIKVLKGIRTCIVNATYNVVIVCAFQIVIKQRHIRWVLWDLLLFSLIEEKVIELRFFMSRTRSLLVFLICT